MRTRATESHLSCSLELPLVPAHQPLLGTVGAPCAPCAAGVRILTAEREENSCPALKRHQPKPECSSSSSQGLWRIFSRLLFPMTNPFTHAWGHRSAGEPGSSKAETGANLWTRERIEVHCCRDVDLNNLLAPEIHFLELFYPMARLSSLSDILSSELPLWAATWQEMWVAPSLFICVRSQEHRFCVDICCNKPGNAEKKQFPSLLGHFLLK